MEDRLSQDSARSQRSTATNQPYLPGFLESVGTAVENANLEPKSNSTLHRVAASLPDIPATKANCERTRRGRSRAGQRKARPPKYPAQMIRKLPEHRRMEVERSYEQIANRELYRRLQAQKAEKADSQKPR